MKASISKNISGEQNCCSLLVIGRRQKYIKFSDLYGDTLIKRLDVPKKIAVLLVKTWLVRYAEIIHILAVQ